MDYYREMVVDCANIITDKKYKFPRKYTIYEREFLYTELINQLEPFEEYELCSKLNKKLKHVKRLIHKDYGNISKTTRCV